MENEKVLLTDIVWFQEGPGVRNTQYTDSGVKLLNVANLVDGKVDLSTSSRYISEEEAYGKYKHFLKLFKLDAIAVCEIKGGSLKL